MTTISSLKTTVKQDFSLTAQKRVIDSEAKKLEQGIEKSKVQLKVLKEKENRLVKEEKALWTQVEKVADKQITQAKETMEELEKKEKVVSEKEKALIEQKKALNKQAAQVLNAQTKSSGALFESIGFKESPLKTTEEIQSFSDTHFPNSDIQRTKISVKVGTETKEKIVFKLLSFVPYIKFFEKKEEWAKKLSKKVTDFNKIDFSEFVGGFPTEVKPLADFLKTANTIKEVTFLPGLSDESKKILNDVKLIRKDLTLTFKGL